MAFVPSIETQKILKTGEPLARLLEKETRLKIKTSIPTSYSVVVEGMGAGTIDVGWLPPLAYVLGHQKYGIEALLMVTRYGGKKSYRGQILIRTGEIKNLSDLKGKRFAFVEASSTSGYLFPKALLLKNGVNPEQDFKRMVFAGGHDKVVFALLQGTVDAGATFDDARTRVIETFPDVMQKTQVLAYTDWIPNDNISVRKGLPKDVIKRLKEGLLKIAGTPEGKKYLMELYEIDGLAEVSDADYQPVTEAAQLLKITSPPEK